MLDKGDGVRWLESKDGKFSVKSLYKVLRAGFFSLLPNKDNLELLGATKNKFLCLRSFMGKSSNYGPNS